MNTEPHERPVPRTLIACFTGLPDPRIDRTRWHKRVDILVIGLCSQLTGGEGFTDMAVFGKAKRDWLKTFLELPRGIPSHDTFNRGSCARRTIGCFPPSIRIVSWSVLSNGSRRSVRRWRGVWSRLTEKRCGAP